MKILNLSSVDYGGAGQMAFLYHNFLRQLGHESFMIVKDSKSSLPLPVYKRRFSEKISLRLFKIKYRKLQLNTNYHFYNRLERSNIVSANEILRMCPFKPDIILLYWVSEFINAKAISDLRKLSDARIFWFMIDNAAITGGCHYPFECDGYRLNCTSCPAIVNPSYKKLATQNLQSKLTNLPSELTLITFSSTDFKRAACSKVFSGRKILQHLAYVDENIYIPAVDREAIKQYWGIASDQKVIFFGAANLNDQRKGYSILIEAVNLIQDEGITLLIAGNADLKVFKHKCIVVGFLDEKELIKAYQVADVFLCPSIEDSGPVMINQSIMCGTPVIAFDTGVAPDLIHNSVTGYIAKQKNAQELQYSLELFLRNDVASSALMRTKCRLLGEQLLGKSATLQRLENMFETNN